MEGMRTFAMMLRCTGWRASVPFSVAAAGIVVAFPDGLISHVGPVTFAPSIPVVLLTPLLLAMAIGLSVLPWPTPVVRQGPRPALARLLSYVLTGAIAAAVVALSAALSGQASASGVARNVMWLSGVSAATSALFGVVYAWLPGIVLGCGALLSSVTTDPWTLYGMVLAPSSPGSQLVLASLVGALGLLVAVLDPRGRGALMTPRGAPPQRGGQSRRRRRQASRGHPTTAFLTSSHWRTPSAGKR